MSYIFSSFSAEFERYHPYNGHYAYVFVYKTNNKTKVEVKQKK